MSVSITVGETTIEKKECELCGYSKYTGSLHIHHINGDKKNNDISNLSVLCSNCHMEHHHKNKRLYKHRVNKNTRTKNTLVNENEKLKCKINDLIHIIVIRDIQINQQLKKIQTLRWNDEHQHKTLIEMFDDIIVTPEVQRALIKDVPMR